jgi:hypothetical protein
VAISHEPRQRSIHDVSQELSHLVTMIIGIKRRIRSLVIATSSDSSQ